MGRASHQLLNNEDMFAEAERLQTSREGAQTRLKVGDVEKHLKKAEFIATYQTAMIEHAALGAKKRSIQNIDDVYHIYPVLMAHRC